MSRRAAFAFIALVALAMFARPLFRGEVLTFRDHSDYFQPLRYFTTVELRNFRLPLWNPYNASGEPWLANPQTAVFYPPYWIFLVLPFAQAYVLFLLLHIVLLGCGAFLLFEQFASSRAAFVGAIALMLCGPVLSMLDIQNTLTTFAWLPLVILCALRRVSPAASALVIAMSFLAGEPFFAAIGAAMFAAICVRTGFSRSVRLKTALTVTDAALTSFCVSAVALVPFLALIGGSDRAGRVPAEEVLRDSMPWSDWLRLVVPGLPQEHFIPVVYIGIVPALLAIAGIASIARVRAARWWLLLLALSAIFAAGRFFPPIGALLVHLPVTLLRYPARLVPFVALAIAALAAIGFDRVCRREWMFFAAIALVIVDLVPRIAPLLQSAPFNAHAVPYALSVGRAGKIIRVGQPEGGFNRFLWISGYLNLFERRFDAWTAAPVLSESYLRAYESALRDRRALDAMSIEFVLTPSPRGIAVDRNPRAFPLAYFRDARGTIFGTSLLAFTTSAVFVVVDAPSDGTLVVTQRSAPGWSVDVDRAPAIAQREGAFRAVRVARGHHQIVWRYHPRSFAIGIALTILGLARMLLAKFFVKRQWHKNIFSTR